MRGKNDYGIMIFADKVIIIKIIYELVKNISVILSQINEKNYLIG